MSLTTTVRRPKWHPTPPPPPPSPKILNLPRRTRRKPPRKTAAKPSFSGELIGNYMGRLRTLFDQERGFSRTVPIVLLNSAVSGGDGERREKVEDTGGGGGGGGCGAADERWSFQAEILRAECNFLRMEREFALKKLERNREQMERTLRSAVQTLVSGKKKIYEGKNAKVVLEEEIEDLEGKLGELQRSSGIKDLEVQNCSNFDKKASLLERRLEKLVVGPSDEECGKEEIRDMAEASFSINSSRRINGQSLVSDHKSNDKFRDVELLRRKMEGLSKGMLDRMEEECWLVLPTTANSCASKPVEFPDSSSLSMTQPYQEATLHEGNECSGRCKSMVRRIVEQVRAETEQWSQMQEMLGQVREEMEELQVSRDFWEHRALDSDYEIQSLRSKVQQWRQKALIFEAKSNDLQAEVSVLREELEKKKKLSAEKIEEGTKTKGFAPLSLSAQMAKERNPVPNCDLKENHHHLHRHRHHHHPPIDTESKRSPFQEIGNSSPKLRQYKSKTIFPLHFLQTSDPQKRF